MGYIRGIDGKSMMTVWEIYGDFILFNGELTGIPLDQDRQILQPNGKYTGITWEKDGSLTGNGREFHWISYRYFLQLNGKYTG